MDEFIQSLIVGAPNVAVALIVLYWQHKRIEALQQHIIEQNDRLTGKTVGEAQAKEPPGGP